MPRSVRARVFVIIATLASLLVTSGSAGATGLEVARVSGADRFQTAVEISKAAYPEGSPIVFVATGRDFADAVAIGATGGRVGPVLLVQPDSLPSATAEELQRLNPFNVVILGGTAAISDGVALAIARNARGSTVAVDRLRGADRYETAIAIANAFRPEAPVVYLADGFDYAAGLIASAAAGARDGVLLTTSPTALPRSVRAELDRRQPEEIVIVGDVSQAVVDQAAATGAVTRVITADSATELSVRVSEELWESGMDILLASAADFPDALAGGAWAVASDVPLLLTNPASLDDVTACEVLRLGATRAIIAGGTAAVSQSVADTLQQGISPFARGCSGSALVTIPDPDPSTLDVEVTLYEMTTSPDSTRAYVVNNNWNSVEVIDLTEGVWLGRISVGSDPVDLDLSEDGKTLYVMNNGSQTISKVDTTKPFESAEVKQIAMLGAGTNSRRNYAIESSDDGNLFIIPGQLSTVESDVCLQVLAPNGSITELEPGFDPDIPFSATQMFRSADGKLVGVIAKDRGPEVPDEPVRCDPEATEPEPDPSPSPSETPAETTSETAGEALYTYVNGTWSRIGAWGREVADIAYGNIDENGVTTDGSGTTTVFDASGRSIVLGTVSSTSGTSYGLALQPLQPNCPKNRGNPAICTQLAYNVVGGDESLGAVDVLDVTEGLNVQGSYRVIDQFPLQTNVGPYGGGNQVSDPALQNKATVTADASRLVVATEFAVEIFPIG